MSNEFEQPKTVLVTGASAGIGKELALTFAENGFDVVLVARREDKLKQVEEEIKKQYGQMAYSVAEDLADPEAPKRLFNWCQEKSIQVDALVNNAGYAIHSEFLNADWQTHRDFVQVLNLAPLELCHLFAPGMKERGYGRIINLASIAAFSPQLKGNLYGAAKSFVLDFSQALDLELRDHGVYCTALCPGLTYSEFHDVMGTRDITDKLPKFVWMSADKVAEEGFAAVMEGKPVHINGLMNQGFSQVMSMLPPSIKNFLSRSQKIME